MVTLNLFLELINGVAVILTVCLLIFLTFYLGDWLAYKHRSGWDALLIGLPPAIALASLIYMNEVGIVMARLVGWVWRAFYNGAIPFTPMEVGFIIAGCLISSTAIIFMIRLLTLPRLGNWPWIASAIAAVVYVIFSIIGHWVIG